MSLLAQASNYEPDNKNNRYNGTVKKRTSTLPTPGCRNKTIKKMLSPNIEDEYPVDRENFESHSPASIEDNNERSAKVQEIIHNIGSVKTDNDGTGLANFNYSPDSTEKPVVKSVAPSFSTNTGLGNSYESYQDIYTTPSRIGEYPYYKPNPVTSSNFNPMVPDKFNEKMNYIIHLLEEQQKEPTNHITEEFILYTFLGIFVIYIVDSFSRVGKYIR